MHRTALVLLLALSPGPAAAQGLPRPGCDPIAYSTPEPVPASEAIVCGDGRLGSYTASCSRSCAGGCEGVSGCGPVQCLTATEVCDGAALGGASCRSLGFAGGTLACDATCAGFDTSGCRVCRSRICRESPLEAPIDAVQIVPSGSRALLLSRVAGGVRFAVLSDDLTVGAPAELAAEAYDALPIEGGWLLGTTSARIGHLHRIDPDGSLTELDTLSPEVGEVTLWSLDRGGVVVTTGGARGAPVRVLDSSGAAVAPTFPAHATRPDGGRLLLVASDCGGVLDATATHPTMVDRWDAAPGDLLLAFTRPNVAGAQIVRSGSMWRGLGFLEDAMPPLRAHCGVLGAPGAGTGWIDLRVTGRRYRDVFEPDDGGAPIVFAGALPSAEPPSPRRPLFALHPSVRVLGHARLGRRLVGLAIVERSSGHALVVSAGR